MDVDDSLGHSTRFQGCSLCMYKYKYIYLLFTPFFLKKNLLVCFSYQRVLLSAITRYPSE